MQQYNWEEVRVQVLKESTHGYLVCNVALVSCLILCSLGLNAFFCKRLSSDSGSTLSPAKSPICSVTSTHHRCSNSLRVCLDVLMPLLKV